MLQKFFEPITISNHVPGKSMSNVTHYGVQWRITKRIGALDSISEDGQLFFHHFIMKSQQRYKSKDPIYASLQTQGITYTIENGYILVDTPNTWGIEKCISLHTIATTEDMVLLLSVYNFLYDVYNGEEANTVANKKTCKPLSLKHTKAKLKNKLHLQLKQIQDMFNS